MNAWSDMNAKKPKTLLLATHNRGKLRELRELIADLPNVTLRCLADLDEHLEVEETGKTFAENAELKARVVAEATGAITLADDSGLEVDALGGRPGVFSARYAGPDATDADRVAKLLAELIDNPEAERKARFRCAVALVRPQDPALDGDDKSVLVALEEGASEGTILRAPVGKSGFGYDPVFFSPTLGKTFAEAGAAEKNRVSHRGRAMLAILPALRALLS